MRELVYGGAEASVWVGSKGGWGRGSRGTAADVSLGTDGGEAVLEGEVCGVGVGGGVSISTDAGMGFGEEAEEGDVSAWDVSMFEFSSPEAAGVSEWWGCHTA